MSISPFILASASPRRVDLLTQAGLTPAHIIPADIDETPHKDELPKAYVMRMAHEKAQAVAANHAGQVILAADTVVTMGRRILPKAEDEAQAKQCLTRLSGRRHTVLTAVAVAQINGTIQVKLAETAVRFKCLSIEEIKEYLASNEWQGKAGGYALQGRAAAFIPWINGAYDTVVGLPLHIALPMLRSAR